MENYLEHYTGLCARKKYDAKTALSLAVLCELAYKKETVIHRELKKLEYTDAAFVSVTKGADIDTQCFIASDDSNIVIVFRGSSSSKDWAGNLYAARNPGPFTETKAHEGIQDALFPAVIMITNAIDELQKGSQKKIWVSGHSLGGALASLYSAMLFEAGYAIYGIYTFASNRVGDDPFAKQLDANMKKGGGPHYRVMNRGDVVPHLPPEPLFSHSGNRIILEKNKSLKDKPSWWKLKADMFEELMKMTVKNFVEVKPSHQLLTDVGYIPRLVRQVSRGE